MSSDRKYAFECAKLVAAQLADAAGYEAVQQSSLDILSDILLRYMDQVSAASHANAELCGRSESNALDVLLSLNDLGFTVDTLLGYIKQNPSIPFSNDIQPFPDRKTPPKRTPAFAAIGEIPPPHIPTYLPAFPDAHTYKETAVFPSRNQNDVVKRQVDLTKQREEAQSAFVKLQSRLSPDNAVLTEAAKRDAPEEGAAAEAGLSIDQVIQDVDQQQQQQPITTINVFNLAPSAWEASQAASVPPALLPSAINEPSASSWNWKEHLEKGATLASSGRPLQDAFEPAYLTDGGDRQGRRREKGRSGVTIDSTKTRVEELLLRGGIVETAEATVEEEQLEAAFDKEMI
jgi:hypothetical protein